MVNKSFVHDGKDVFPPRSWEMAWYSVITLFAISGNFVVLTVIFKGGPKLQQMPFNMWLSSLAIADTLLCIIAAPNYILSTSAYNHPGGLKGDILCKVLTGYAMSGWLAEASIYNLVGISIERLRVIARPLSARALTSTFCTKTKIAFAWILAFLVISPRFFGLRYRPRDMKASVGNYCIYEWPSLALDRTLYVFVFIMNYIVPLFTLIYTSFRIRKHLQSQENAIMCMASLNSYTRNTDEDMNKKRYSTVVRGRKRTERTLLLVVLAFFICWTPHRIMYFIFQFSGGNSFVWNTPGFQIGILLGFSNSFVNCVLYAFQCEKFRKQFAITFPSAGKLFNLPLKHTRNLGTQTLREALLQQIK